jgi:carboxypeptidase Q
MKISFSLLLVFLASWCYAQKEYVPVFQAINTEVLANSNAYELLKESTTAIGHRLTGSENGKKAEQHAFDYFKKIGLNPVFQPFQTESWSRKSIHFHVLQQDGSYKEIKAVALAHSPESVDLKGELFPVGNGLEADYSAIKEKVKGKIVLASLGLMPGTPAGTKNLHRSEKTALAIKYGAAGIVLYNSVQNGVLLTGTASVTGKINPIPAVCIGLEDGQALQKEIEQKATNNQSVEVQISMRNNSGQIQARNVIARITGKKYPQQKIIVCGHLDSWDLATGATDNGLGAYQILDMARTYQKLGLQPDRTIEFVLFMGEEQGLLGSRFYVDQLIKSKKIDEIQYVFNFDMSGATVGFGIGGRTEASDFFKVVGAHIQNVDTTFKNLQQTGAGLHSDHQPFLLQGIPTASSVNNMPSSIYKCYHADCDDISLIDPSWMKDHVRFCSMMLWAIANTAIMPANKLNEEETRILLEKNGLKEALQISGEWRWKN